MEKNRFQTIGISLVPIQVFGSANWMARTLWPYSFLQFTAVSVDNTSRMYGPKTPDDTVHTHLPLLISPKDLKSDARICFT